MIYWTLFVEFVKIGLFAVGGGLATLPFLQKLAATYGWISADELLDIVAISEATPGPIGVNAATFVGYLAAGVAGGIVATAGVVAPAVALVALLAGVIRRFAAHPRVYAAFSTLRPAVVGIIAAAALQLAETEFFSRPEGEAWGIRWPSVVLACVALAAMLRLRWHPVVFLAVAAVLGILLRL